MRNEEMLVSMDFGRMEDSASVMFPSLTKTLGHTATNALSNVWNLMKKRRRTNTLEHVKRLTRSMEWQDEKQKLRRSG